MMSCILILMSIVLIINNCVFSLEITKELVGYHEGYLPDCPSTLKPAFIAKGSLRELGFTVFGPTSSKRNSEKLYNYYQVSQLAKDPNLDFNKTTMIFVGGYMNIPQISSFTKKHGQVYKKIGNNAMQLRMEYFMIREFPLAVRMVRPIAIHTAEMLTNLTAAGLDPKKLHLVGFGLGGQIISFIAKNFYKNTGIKIGRLTGLEPVGTCFRNLGPDQRLDKTDADFVDVLYTNIDSIGMAYPMGHVNFYINGGEWQPFNIHFLPCPVICSHFKSATIWKSALLHPYSFIAMKCESVEQARHNECYDNKPLETNLVGQYTNKSNTGIFYLATAPKWPHFLGEDGLKKENMFWAKNQEEFNQNLLVL